MAPMTSRRGSRLLIGGRRQHGAIQHVDRRQLERAGWRTTLEYRENHVRGRDGRLRQLHVEWHAVAERSALGSDLAPLVITASGSTVDKAWSRLLLGAELAVVDARSRDPELRAVTATMPATT